MEENYTATGWEYIFKVKELSARAKAVDQDLLPDEEDDFYGMKVEERIGELESEIRHFILNQTVNSIVCIGSLIYSLYYRRPSSLGVTGLATLGIVNDRYAARTIVEEYALLDAIISDAESKTPLNERQIRKEGAVYDATEFLKPEEEF